MARTRVAPVDFDWSKRNPDVSQNDELTFAAAGALQFQMPAITDDDQADASDMPPAFVAVTLNWLEVPAVSPVTDITPDPPLAGAANETVAVVDAGEVYEQPSPVIPVTMKVLFVRFVRPRTWIDPLDARALIVALCPEFDVAVTVQAP